MQGLEARVMRSECYRCGMPLDEGGGTDVSHGICFDCARALMKAAGVCPPGSMTAADIARCREQCPVAGHCVRLMAAVDRSTA